MATSLRSRLALTLATFGLAVSAAVGVPSQRVAAATPLFADAAHGVGPAHVVTPALAAQGRSGSARNVFSGFTYYASELVTDGTTDNTKAFQEAIDYCVARGLGTLVLPPGVIFIDGSFGGANGENAQLRLPSQMSPPGGLKIVGQGATGVLQGFTDLNAPTGGGTVIKTTRAGSGNLFGIGATGGDTFSRINLVFEDFSVVTYDNPDITAFDLRKAANLGMRNIFIYDAKSSHMALPQPTHTGSYGVRFPSTDNAAVVWADNLQVIGFYNGIEIGECFQGVGQVFIYACRNAVRLTPMNHAVSFSNLQTSRCPYNLVAPESGGARVTIESWRYEYHAPTGAWYDEVYTVDDASNRIKGMANIFPVQEGVGADAHTVKNSATSFALTAF